jgi:hypothetical protein
LNNFALAVCDTQSSGFSVVLTIISSKKRTSFCEIVFQFARTLSPQFCTAYRHELDRNWTAEHPNWADNGYYLLRLSPQFLAVVGIPRVLSGLSQSNGEAARLEMRYTRQSPVEGRRIPIASGVTPSLPRA